LSVILRPTNSIPFSAKRNVAFSIGANCTLPDATQSHFDTIVEIDPVRTNDGANAVFNRGLQWLSRLLATLAQAFARLDAAAAGPAWSRLALVDGGTHSVGKAGRIAGESTPACDAVVVRTRIEVGNIDGMNFSTRVRSIKASVRSAGWPDARSWSTIWRPSSAVLSHW
jgi:hypothetical protein